MDTIAAIKAPIGGLKNERMISSFDLSFRSSGMAYIDNNQAAS